jgi:succinate dehydrogenase hydrophobic anchor subunit
MSVLSLKSFHIVFIGSAIVLTAGLGIWGILNDYPKAGSLSLAVGALLVIYVGYFVGRAERTHLN